MMMMMTMMNGLKTPDMNEVQVRRMLPGGRG
jgi:hypothetical protein